MIQKLLFLLLTLQSLILASDSNTSQKSDQEIYKEAVLDFKSLRYQEAYQKFDELFFNHLDNQNINFYLGRSAFEIHKYELSMSAFERILMVDPKNVRTRLELARVYFMMKMYESSEVEFLDILKNKELPKEVRDKINYYLYLIESTRKRSSLSTVVAIGFGYDSNTNSGSIEDTLNIAGTDLPNNNKPVSDNFNQALASVTHSYDFGKKGGLILKNNIMALEKSYLSQQDKNILFINYSPTLSYQGESSTFDFSLGTDYLVYGQSPMVNSFFFSPKYTTMSKENWLTSYYYKQRFNRYSKKEMQNRNSTVYEGAYSISKSFKSETMFSTQALGQYERADSSAGDNIDVNRIVGGANILLVQGLPLNSSIKFQTQLRATQYTQKNADNTKRRDIYANAVLTYSYKMDSNMFIDLQYNYAKNYSNQDPYNYSKNIVMSNFTYTF